MTREPLRVGLRLEGSTVPAWIARIVGDIANSKLATIAAVIPAQPAAPSGSRLARALRGVYDAVDRRVFRLKADPLAATDLSSLLDGIPDVAPGNLDVILDFASTRLRDNDLARFGVWSYDFGDEYRAVFSRSAMFESALRDANGRVLVRSWSRTDPVSVRRNRVASYWKSAAFTMRALREAYARGRAPQSSTTPASAPARELGVGTFARFGREVVRDRAHRLTTREPWVLAYGVEARRGDVPSQSPAKLALIVPPPDRFWADPFVAKHGDGWVIIFEEKLYAEKIAWISAMQVAADGSLGEPFKVLERDYHLSYPFIFRWRETWWMIPETSQNRTIELWRASDFPRGWTLERTLLDGIQAVDATLLARDGIWWMFCNIAEPGASKDDELHLFSAATPLGPWTPHPKNPIKSDVRSARPAGRLFEDNGQWYRPAQDGSGLYGSRIVVHRIDRLDHEHYDETEVSHLAPDPASAQTGLHTINACDGLTVMDVRIRRPRLRMLDRLGRS